MHMHLAIFLLCFAISIYAQCQNRASLDWAHRPQIAAGLRGHVIYNGLSEPRGIKFDDKSNLLIIEREVGVIALTERQNGTCIGWEKSVVVRNADLNHGLEVNGTRLYASTQDAMFEYVYNSTSISTSGSPRIVVRGMGGITHSTRTLQLEWPNVIISRGSDNNIDPTAANLASGVSQLRRFVLTTTVPDGGYAWTDGELLAYGLRNTVGMALGHDRTKLWTVENSADQLTWRGQDVHLDNPAEELNLVDLKGTTRSFFGYPSCYTVYKPEQFNEGSFNVGDQFTIETGTSATDAWCANTSNVARPTLSMQAHSAPLDITFFTVPPSGERSYSVEPTWDGHAFVSFHGSWNRDPPTGYGVIRIPWGENKPLAPISSTDGYSFIVQAPDLSQCPSKCIRPVGLAFDYLGRLFVSSDATGEVFILESASAPGSNTSPSGYRVTIGLVVPLFLILLL